MTAAILALTGLFIAFVVYHGWCEMQWSRERQRLINALQARTPGEFIALERERTRTPVQQERDAYDADLEPVGWSG